MRQSPHELPTDFPVYVPWLWSRSMSATTCYTRAWRQHKNEVRGFLQAQTGSAAEADDLLQEIFLKAVLQGERFCTLGDPRAWLFHVARNLLIDRQRLKKNLVPVPEDLSAESEPLLAPVDLLSQCLPRVLSELSVEDREVLTFCDIQGGSQRAYAERLGLSLPAVKSRIQRARLRLRAQLADACQVRFDESGSVCCFVPRPPLGPANLK